MSVETGAVILVVSVISLFIKEEVRKIRQWWKTEKRWRRIRRV